MFTFAYPAVFKRDEGKRLLVSFADFPTAHTDGADVNEAMEEAIDCLGSSIAFAMADKADVPKPSRLKRGQKLVPVPLWIVATRLADNRVLVIQSALVASLTAMALCRQWLLRYSNKR